MYVTAEKARLEDSESHEGIHENVEDMHPEALYFDVAKSNLSTKGSILPEAL